jgi:hypothetical protein
MQHVTGDHPIPKPLSVPCLESDEQQQPSSKGARVIVAGDDAPFGQHHISPAKGSQQLLACKAPATQLEGIHQRWLMVQGIDPTVPPESYTQEEIRLLYPALILYLDDLIATLPYYIIPGISLDE